MCIRDSYIFNALESEVLYDLLDIMNGNCNAEIKLFSNNMQKIKTYKAVSYTHLDVYKRQVGNSLKRCLTIAVIGFRMCVTAVTPTAICCR